MLRIKPINILYRYNGEFLSVRAGGTHCNDSDFRGYQLITLAIYIYIYIYIHTIIILSDQYSSSFPAAIQMRVRWEGLISSYGLRNKRAVGK